MLRKTTKREPNRKNAVNTGINPRFRLWFVDLEPGDPVRFFRIKNIKGAIDSLEYAGDDYRKWLSQLQPLPHTNGLRIALVSKLLDVFSRFTIRRFSFEDDNIDLLKISLSPNLESTLPAMCFGAASSGAPKLTITKSQLLQEGVAYTQTALSSYYHGLLQLFTPYEQIDSPINAIFLPIRAFNPDCLITINGQSVISRLAESCNYLIIEDADLTPQDLVSHAVKYLLDDLSIINMTKNLKLKRNYIYLIGQKNTKYAAFSGEQIW